MREPPVVYVMEGNAIVEKVAPIVEHECWWCKNPYMYEVTTPSMWVGEVVWYECPSCGAKVDQYEKVFKIGVGERRTSTTGEVKSK